jgi:hypothetical protein
LARLRATGDPLADAVIQELHATPGSSEMLQAGIRDGLASVPDAPPAVRAFLQDTENAPAWAQLDPEALRLAPDAYQSVPPFWKGIALTLALLHVYSSPTIAAVLARTGRLNTGAASRLGETGKWLNTAMLPGALERGAPGYVATIKVRLLHARIRAGVTRGGWDVSASGMAMNALDISRTWLSFWYLPLRLQQKLGFSFTEAEIEQLRKHNLYIGHLLGVPAEVCASVDSLEQAEGMFDLLDAASGRPDDNSRTLTANLPVFTADGLMGKLFKKLGCAMVRRLFGKQFADDLGVGRSLLGRAVFPLIVAVNRRKWRRLRTTPGAWQANIEATIARYRARVEKNEPTEYEQ